MVYASDIVRLLRKYNLRVVEKPSAFMGEFDGLNFLADKGKGFIIPKGTIFVDESLSKSAKDRIVRHEVRELLLMIGGLKYEGAHRVALKKEGRVLKS